MIALEFVLIRFEARSKLCKGTHSCHDVKSYVTITFCYCTLYNRTFYSTLLPLLDEVLEWLDCFCCDAFPWALSGRLSSLSFFLLIDLSLCIVVDDMIDLLSSLYFILFELGTWYDFSFLKIWKLMGWNSLGITTF